MDSPSATDPVDIQLEQDEPSSQHSGEADAPLSLLCEYLDTLPLPAFIARLADERHSHTAALYIHYTNSALQDLQHAYQRILGGDLGQAPLAQLTGRLAHIRTGKPPPMPPCLELIFHGYRWSASTVGTRWAVVTATGTPSSIPIAEFVESSDTSSARGSPPPSAVPAKRLPRRSAFHRQPLGRVSPQGQLGDADYLSMIRRLDWSATSFGAIASWTPELRLTCETALASPDPACVCWGQDYVLFYNKAYSEMIGDKHPWTLGRPIVGAYDEAWDLISTVFKSIESNGRAVKHKGLSRYFARAGATEEVYVDHTFSPIVGPDASVVGHLIQL